ncbi:unnamed protein product [Rhizophagus irregularis]|nr:unnamed protein product [Rhizophagus irregularis]
MSFELLKLSSKEYGDILKSVVGYIYSSIIDLTKYDIKTNVEVLIAADELCLYDLCSYIENELLKNEALLKNNFILIHNVANKFNQFTNLLQFYRTNFQKDPNIILRTNDFTTIQKETLLNFLSEYRQSLNHTEVWDKLIEWAIAQSHELPLDVIRWTSSEITKFRGIIQSFIPHINFKEISPADFSHKFDQILK